MNDSSDNVVSIKILDRSYQIKCTPDEVQALQESANYVDEQMRKMRHSGNSTSTDRIAVVTALNICHELMLLKKQKSSYIDVMNRRIQDLQHRIQNFLTSAEETTA